MKRHLSSQLLSTQPAVHDAQADPSKLLNLAVEQFDLGTWKLDLGSGQATWSRKVYEIHGLPYSSKPVDLEAAVKVYHPTDATTVAWLIMQAAKYQRGFTFVLRLRRPDGEYRLVESTANYEPATSKSSAYLYGLFRDVTTKLTKEDLALVRNKMVKSIINNSPIPIVILDKNFKYLQVSPAWASYYGYEHQAALVGTDLRDSIPNIPANWEKLHAPVFDNQTVKLESAPVSLIEGREPMSSIAFPWVSAAGVVSGMIIMLSNGDALEDAEEPLEQIANLMA